MIWAATTLGSLLLLALPAADERALPPAPPNHFSDGSGRVTRDAAERLDARLARYERETTNQVVVAVFEKLPWTPLEEFTRATANAWRVGQRGKDNGVVLFVFLEDRLLRLQVGLGLEKILTNTSSQRILDEVITPRFRAGDMAGGLEAAVEAIITVLSGRPLPASPAPKPES